MEETDNTANSENNVNQENVVNDKPKVKQPFWKRHFLKLFLLLLLVVSLAWGYFGKKQTISHYEEKIANMEEIYDAEIKEIKSNHIKDISQSLAFSVRSEMMVDNMNQVNQYILQALKMYDVERIMIVNHETANVILSTNAKDTDTQFSDKNHELITTKKAIKRVFDNHTYTATPINGFNEQLAVMLIQVD